MKAMTQWIVAKVIDHPDRVNDMKVRAQYGSLEGWVSIVINTLLFVVKIGLGLAIHSISLIADSVHTLSDSVTSMVVIIGFKMARKPSDRQHPFGHGRMESVATLVVAVLLFAVCVDLMESSIRSIIHPTLPQASNWVIGIVCGTLVIKELLAQFSFDLGRMIDSKVLIADGLHHRSDVWATAMVVAALIASRFGVGRIDGVMGVGVSLVIIYTAFNLMKHAISPLLGEAPSAETIRRIEELVKNHSGALDVHDIIIHQYGPTRLISLHLEVADKEPVGKLHVTAEDIEEAISKAVGGTVIAHIDPVNPDHPQYHTIRETIQWIVAEDKRIDSFHDLRIIGMNPSKCRVVFDIILVRDLDELETYDLIQSIKDKFKVKFPKMPMVIKAEPKFSFNS